MAASRIEPAWLAGFFDGEGCISIVRINKRPTKPEGNLTVRVYITQKNVPLLAEIQHEYGGGIFPSSPNALGSCHRLAIQKHSEVLVFLRTVLPYLKVKREQTLRAIQVLEEKK